MSPTINPLAAADDIARRIQDHEEPRMLDRFSDMPKPRQEPVFSLESVVRPGGERILAEQEAQFGAEAIERHMKRQMARRQARLRGRSRSGGALQQARV